MARSACTTYSPSISCGPCRDRFKWQAKGLKYGLDGWAQRSAVRGQNAYVRDTEGGKIVTNCSAHTATRMRRKDHLDIFPTTRAGNVKWWAYLSSLSVDARPDIAGVRRWELAGWKNSLDTTASDGTAAYTGSAALFHGWEGGAGGNDCEPLMVPLALQPEVYTNYFAYTFR